MKVLHINQSDITGGAGIAAYRLHLGLDQAHIDSKLLVGKAETDDANVNHLTESRYLDYPVRGLFYTLGLKPSHALSAVNVFKHPFFLEADVVNLHNIHTGYFSYFLLPKLTHLKNTVITLHDMWAFTGGCTYSYDCSRWRNSCGQCPNLSFDPILPWDNTPLDKVLKEWVYNHSQMTVVTPSLWLYNLAQESILQKFSIHHIPYGINTSIYHPQKISFARTLLDLPHDKYILLFASVSFKDKRKGGTLLVEALHKLSPKLSSRVILLTLGEGGQSIARSTQIPVINLGYVGNDRLKSLIFSAADLFIFPTLADNLPLVLQESMSCGLPMVSFAVGGVPELVRHEITGYLANATDPQDLAKGVEYLLDDIDLREKMKHNCREIALAEYSLELQAQRYISLYEDLLSSK